MRRAAAAFFLLLAPSFAAQAHALDEYLQAVLLSLQPGKIEIALRLVPGVSTLPRILKLIDRNGDGILSAVEQQDYAARVLADLSLSVDGEALTPQLASAQFPPVAAMREGLGEIRLIVTAPLPPGGHRLVFENHHQRAVAAYLVNSLVPQDKALRLLTQTRSPDQARYDLAFEAGAGVAASGAGGTFTRLFRLGLAHIGEGTDHLLFLLALLLPAPLLARQGRWGAAAGSQASLWRIVKMVTAFTLGHSLTLALATLGVVPPGGGGVEILIALSILVSAAHALRPLFPDREPLVAGCFGLIHGLAFAATLTHLGLDPWSRVAGLAGFNLGIEAMQLAVIAAVLPSLLLLSHRRWYAGLRIGGALFAGLAALGWLGERALGLANPLEPVVLLTTRAAPYAALALFLAGLGFMRRYGAIALLRRNFGS